MNAYGKSTTKPMKTVKKKLQSEVLIGCLDVLCRANASIFESDPKLASEISQAIDALTESLQAEGQQNENRDYKREDNSSKYVPDHDDEIVDVLTNEVIYKHSQLDHNKK